VLWSTPWLLISRRRLLWGLDPFVFAWYSKLLSYKTLFGYSSYLPSTSIPTISIDSLWFRSHGSSKTQHNSAPLSFLRLPCSLAKRSNPWSLMSRSLLSMILSQSYHLSHWFCWLSGGISWTAGTSSSFLHNIKDWRCFYPFHWVVNTWSEHFYILLLFWYGA
jgi:hypothetical protein